MKITTLTQMRSALLGRPVKITGCGTIVNEHGYIQQHGVSVWVHLQGARLSFGVDNVWFDDSEVMLSDESDCIYLLPSNKRVYLKDI